MFDFGGGQVQNKKKQAGNTGFNFMGQAPVKTKIQPVQQQKGNSKVEKVIAKSADIVLNRPRQALIAAATYDAKNNNGFLNDLKGGWDEVKAAMRGERQDASGDKYLAAKGIKDGLGRNLAGGVIDVLATPAFNPIMKAGSKVAAPIKNQVVKKIAGASAGGAIYGGTEAIAEEKPANEVIKRAVTDAIMFGGTDAALIGLGKIGKKIFNFSGKTAPRTAAEALPEKFPAQNKTTFDFSKEAEAPAEITPGGWVKAKDRDNYGQLLSIDEESGIAKVGFMNKQTGAQATVSLHKDMLEPVGKATQEKPAFDFSGSPEIELEAAAENIGKESVYNSTRAELQRMFENGDDDNLAKRIQDITGFQGYSRDMFRNLRDAFGNDFEAIERLILQPFDESKAANIKYQEGAIKNLLDNVVDRYGWEKGGKESEFIQLLGEGGFERTVTDPVTGAKKVTKISFNYGDLVNEVGEAKAQQIAEAEKWFRAAYEKVIDDINKTKQEIYPFADERMAEIKAKIEDLKTPGKYSRTVQQDKIKELEWELNAMRENRARRGTQDTRAMQDLVKKIEDLQVPGRYTKQVQTEKIRALEWELNAMRKNPRRTKAEDSAYMQKLLDKIEVIKNDPLYTPEGLRGKIQNLQNELDKLRSSRPTMDDDTVYMQGLTRKIEEVKNDPIYSAEGRQTMIETLEKEHEKALRGKRVPYRKDYFRHYREMGEGFEGLRNIFDSPANIDPALEGISHETLPRAKWASWAQQRVGGAPYELDAIGGFLNYLPSASYAIHIDPHISKFLALADEIGEATTNSRNANNLVRFIRTYSQALGGKTNPIDRVIQEIIPGGRQTFAGLVWINNRIKANTVLGSASSAVAQLANIPQGIAFAKQYAAPGLTRTFASILKPNEAAAAQSWFLAERFGGKMYRQFDNTFLAKPKNAAVWIMETVDRLGTEYIWNSCYEKALAEGIANPVRYADVNTRMLVAGRGIGEAPLGQQSKAFQLIAPFQLEVGNLWHVMGDMVKEKDMTGLAVLTVAMWLFNRGAEQVRGSGVTFDPLQAIGEALLSEDMTAKQRLGRLGGEVLSNVPLGQTAAALFWNESDRKKFFGKEDPTRFGSSILISKGLKDPIFKIAPPFAGSQVEKTGKAIQAIANEGVYTSDGKLKYPVSVDTANIVKGIMFGPSGFREAKDYYDESRKPFSESQTQQIQQGQYTQVMQGRSTRALNAKLRTISNDNSLSPMEKAKRKAELRQKYR